MIDWKNFFDQPIKNDKKTYENIGKIAIGQGDNYTTGCLLDYAYFKNYYKMTAINLSKQQALDVDPRAIQQFNFTANLNRVENTKIYFILEGSKRNYFGFFTRNCKSFVNLIFVSLIVKLSNLQLNKWKSAIKTESEVVLRLSTNMIVDSDDKINFPHELLLTNRQIVNLCKAFANNLTTNIKLSKTRLSKMIQPGEFLGRLLGPLLKTGLQVIKNVIKTLAKSVLIPLGLTAVVSAADVGIHKKSLRIR